MRVFAPRSRAGVPPTRPVEVGVEMARGLGQVRGLLKGCGVFLLCGGPSMRNRDLSWVGERGVFTCAVNNAWLLARPNMWVGVDPPERFSDVGWRDPGIMKFTQSGFLTAKLRTMTEDGPVPIELTPLDCPNAWGFTRENGFDHTTFLRGLGCQWGNTKNDSQDSAGVQNCRSVLLPTLKILHVLGVSRVYFVGADFRMSTDRAVSAYAWQEDKSGVGRVGNNVNYAKLNTRFEVLRPVLEASGMHVWNTNPNSGLTAFEHKPLEACLAAERLHPHPRTEGWYNAPPRR